MSDVVHNVGSSTSQAYDEAAPKRDEYRLGIAEVVARNETGEIDVVDDITVQSYHAG